jgi:putative ABC transport system permease protein
MTGLWNDVRFAMRGLLRAPSFTAITVGTLGLGIGSLAAIFTVVNGVLLKPLPFDDQEALVSVAHTAPGAALDDVGLSTAMALTYRDEQRSFEDIGFWTGEQVSVTGRGNPERVTAMRVTAAILPILRIQPAVGRRFTREDDTAGAPHTIMLGHAYWQSRFAADPSVRGSTLRVDGIPREIIGVLPPGFRLSSQQEVSIYLPLQLDRGNLNFAWAYQSVARLRPGATHQQAQADVGRMLRIVPERIPEGALNLETIERTRLGPNLRPLKNDVVGNVGNVLWVLLGTAACVLLIACANVSNLFLVRAEGRLQEVAVRTVMGATRGRVARQFSIESVALGLLGGLVGLGLALAGVRLLIWMGPVSVPRLDEIAVNRTVLTVTLGVSLLCGLLFGLFPVFRLMGMDLVAALKEGGRGGSPGRQRHRARHTLVITQTAVAFVLLTGSGLMIRSFQTLQNVDPGFANPSQVLTFRVEIPVAEIEKEEQVLLAYEDMWRRFREIPGVTSVGASTSVTMGGDFGYATLLMVEDFPPQPNDPLTTKRFNWVTGDYFATMQNPVAAGRAIDWADIRAGRAVAMLTANLAEEYWENPRDAIGKRIRMPIPGGLSPWFEVVGVVGDVRDNGVSQDAPPVVFLPLATSTRSLAFAIRTNLPPASLLPQARAAVGAVNPNLPLANVRTLDDILDRSMARTSFTLVTLTIAAAVALALGLVGLYGVIASIVSQRTHEIGVRMALGATRRDVSRMVLRRGMILAGAGVIVGLVAAVGLTRLMSSLLYGVQPTDPITFAAVATLLLAVAFVASYLPASRASRTDPLVALRFE